LLNNERINKHVVILIIAELKHKSKIFSKKNETGKVVQYELDFSDPIVVIHAIMETNI